MANINPRFQDFAFVRRINYNWNENDDDDDDDGDTGLGLTSTSHPIAIPSSARPLLAKVWFLILINAST